MSGKTQIKSALLVFIKNAEAGHVKTRIAQEIGDLRALEIYQKLLDHTRLVSTSVDADRYLFYSKYVVHDDAWKVDHFFKRVQNDGDLGQRMAGAFETTLKTHDKSVIIGSDLPGLTEVLIREAFKKLDQFDVVIGPSLDGGYYLLGMKEMNGTLFEKMPWSTENVLPETVSRLKRAGLSYFQLPPLPDVDLYADWLKYGWP